MKEDRRNERKLKRDRKIDKIDRLDRQLHKMKKTMIENEDNRNEGIRKE